MCGIQLANVHMKHKKYLPPASAVIYSSLVGLKVLGGPDCQSELVKETSKHQPARTCPTYLPTFMLTGEHQRGHGRAFTSRPLGKLALQYM